MVIVDIYHKILKFTTFDSPYKGLASLEWEKAKILFDLPAIDEIIAMVSEEKPIFIVKEHVTIQRKENKWQIISWGKFKS